MLVNVDCYRETIRYIGYGGFCHDLGHQRPLIVTYTPLGATVSCFYMEGA